MESTTIDFTFFSRFFCPVKWAFEMRKGVKNRYKIEKKEHQFKTNFTRERKVPTLS